MLVLVFLVTFSFGSEFSFQTSAKVPPRTGNKLNWFDSGVWNKDGVDSIDQPTIGDTIFVDASNGGCRGPLSTKVEHFSVYLNNITDRYEKVEFLSSYNDTNFPNCRTVVLIDEFGSLNANSIIIRRGVIVFVREGGNISATSIFQEEGSLISGGGYIKADTSILNGDVMSGWYEPNCPQYPCPNCAPLLSVFMGSSSGLTNFFAQKELRFGGFVTLRGSVVTRYENIQARNVTIMHTVSFDSVSFENNVTVAIITVGLTATSLNQTFIPVSFKIVGPSLSVLLRTILASLNPLDVPGSLPTFELRWLRECFLGGSGIQDVCQSDDPAISLSCKRIPPTAGIPCGSSVSSGLSVLLAQQAPSSCKSVFSEQYGVEESNSSSNLVLILAIVIPSVVVLAVLLAVSLYFCRQWEIKKRTERAATKIKSREFQNQSSTVSL